MNIQKLNKVVGGKIISKNKKEIVENITIHSRELVDGGIFLVVGNSLKYIDEIKKKASVIISEEDIKDLKNIGYIKVNSIKNALYDLSDYHKKSYNVPVIAITGSVGKTTLKELVFSMLSSRYEVLKNNGNQNNDIGLPLTLLNLNKNHDIVVLEMGMNHPKEISRLSVLAEPDLGIITNIGSSHIGNLGSKKEVLKAKLEILDGMEKRKIIINNDDKLLRSIKGLEVIKVGSRFGSDVRIKNIKTNLHETNFDLIHNKKKYNISFKKGGPHYPILIAMAIEVGFQYDLGFDEIMEGLNNFEGLDGRIKVYNLDNNITLIDDSYNASLESFDNVLKLIKKDKRNKLIIAGDILELGMFEGPIHNKLIKKFNKIKNGEVWVTGKIFKKLEGSIKMGSHFTKEEILENISNNTWANSIVIVKASRGIGLEEVVDKIKSKY